MVEVKMQKNEIRMYVCMYVHMYVCVHTYVHTYVCMLHPISLFRHLVMQEHYQTTIPVDLGSSLS